MFNQYRNTNARAETPKLYRDIFQATDMHLAKLLEVRNGLANIANKTATSGMTAGLRADTEALQRIEKMVLLDLEKDDKAISLIMNMEEVKKMLAERTALEQNAVASATPSAPPAYNDDYNHGDHSNRGPRN